MHVKGDQIGDRMSKIIFNCKHTLQEMEKVTNRYSEVLGNIPGNGERSMVRRKWRKVAGDNWMKIKWTSEGGSIQGVRDQLTVHTQSINLLVATINRYVVRSASCSSRVVCILTLECI